MSAFLDKADAIATRLKAVPELASVEVIVDRQKDIAAEFSKAMGKTKGGVIIILFDGYQTWEEEVADSLVVSSFSITVWTKPVLRSSDPPADDLVQSVHTSLHGWQHDEFCRHKAVVRRGRIIPNQRFLIHELQTEIRHAL